VTEGSRFTSESKSLPEENIQLYTVAFFNSSIISYSPSVVIHTQTLCVCVCTYSICCDSYSYQHNTLVFHVCKK